jgi:hypothetical protein
VDNIGNLFRVSLSERLSPWCFGITLSNEVTAMHSPIDALLAKGAIRDLLMRYSRGVNRGDAELLKTCFHTDSTDDRGHRNGNGHDFADSIVTSLPQCTHHNTYSVANVPIELDARDNAAAHTECHAIDYLRRAEAAGANWMNMKSNRHVSVAPVASSVWAKKSSWRIAVPAIQRGLLGPVALVVDRGANAARPAGLGGVGLHALGMGESGMVKLLRARADP